MELLARVSYLLRKARLWASRKLAPMADHPLVGAVADMFRSPQELAMENAYLRQQVVVLQRSVKRPTLTTLDRMVLMAGAVVLPTWRSTLAIVKPETILRWHREGFRPLWRRKSKPKGRRDPRVTEETVALIRRMAGENRLWGRNGSAGSF
jgi:putative transposase